MAGLSAEMSMDVLTDLEAIEPELVCPDCERLSVVKVNVAYTLGTLNQPKTAHIMLQTLEICIDVDRCGYSRISPT